MSDINKKLDLIKEEFSIFSDPRDKYIYLVDLAKASKGLPPNDKLENNRVQGCTSQAWVIKQKKDDHDTRWSRSDSGSGFRKRRVIRFK